MGDRIRVGIIGGGRIADMHAPGYLDRDDARILAVCDVSAEVAERRAREWGATRIYLDYRDVLADPEIDAVEILTPHHLHRQMVCDAATARKHVSVQKPMALTIPECDEMISACFYAGVQLKVFENFVFYPPFVMAKRLIQEGEIGDVLTLRLKLGTLTGGWHVPLDSWIWRLNPDECGPGPAIFDDGYHKFSMAVDLFGEIAEVKAWIDRTAAVIDSPAMIAMRFRQSPVLAYFEASFTPNARMRGNYYSADERMEITGTRGTIVMTRCSGRLLDEPPLLLVKDGRTVGFEDLRHDWMDGFRDSTHHFIDALRNFREPKLSGKTARHVMQAALAAYVSSKSGSSVDPATVTGKEPM
ncbi:MAG: Gfo/Idh/MocA family oxidoreductase [Deltaproteobacteria bacterium]|nr:Gfo/Idh/MocA family oxidoreductase [Deltaproteobacteria bacterium]